MGRKKRSLLPAVTEQDIALSTTRLRRTANGWAWKCEYCGQFASSETLAGKYVCRSHGGVTQRQRNPVAQDEARQSGKRVPQPPGRPLHSGVYSRRPKVRVNEIVEDYRARQIDLDCTDEDMLYLRAYLRERIEQRPALQRLEMPLQSLLVRLDAQTWSGEQKGLAWTDQLPQILKEVREVRLLLKQLSNCTSQLENGHARLIKLSKVRAQTRVQNHTARQLDVFTMMDKRLMVVLEEQLTPQDFEALQRRIEQDLSELPSGVVDRSSSIRA